MNQLAGLQRTFLASILDEAAPLPGEWDARRKAGLAIYRNAYRARLVDALRETFERTERLVGEDAFRRAAAHHLITHPPVSWTIDRAGEGFAETCHALFAAEPDVGEIAWLEWSLHQAFTAADCAPLTVAQFSAATARFTEQDWEALTLEFVPGTTSCEVRHDLAALWTTLDGTAPQPDVRRLAEPGHALVWREAERPVFILISAQEGRALSFLRDGGGFGQMCVMLSEGTYPAEVAATAGRMLHSWLAIGAVRSLG